MDPQPEPATHDSRFTIHDSPVQSRERPRTTPVDVERVETRLAEGGIDVSVLVPAKDEAENLPRFMELAAKSLGAG